MVLGSIIFTVLHIILFPYVGSTFGKGLWITLIEAILILIPSIFIYAKLIQKINQRIVKLYIFSFIRFRISSFRSANAPSMRRNAGSAPPIRLKTSPKTTL